MRRVLAPCAAHRCRVELRPDTIELRLRLVDAIQIEQRFGHDQGGLQRIRGRCFARPRKFTSECERRIRLTTTKRQPRFENLQRPLIPPARFRAVLAVGFARLLQVAARRVVIASDQMNLRERVEHTARRLAHELHRAANVERPIERLLGALQAAQPHANLPERGERDSQTVRSARFFLQLHAAFRERQRLLVTMLHQRDVCLVAADGGDDVLRIHREGETFALPHRRQRFVQPSFLRERHAGQRVDHRELTAVAGRVQGGGGLREMFADDRGVADLAVAERQLVVDEANRARIVRTFSGRERLC